MAGQRFELTLPDGSTVIPGTLDSKGKLRLDNLDPGQCSFSLPALEDETWGTAKG